MIETPRKMEGLAVRRQAAGMTQAELAERIGVGRAALSMWEIGVNWPPARILPQLADALLCSIDDLYRAPEGAAAEGNAGQCPALRDAPDGAAGGEDDAK